MSKVSRNRKRALIEKAVFNFNLDQLTSLAEDILRTQHHAKIRSSIGNGEDLAGEYLSEDNQEERFAAFVLKGNDDITTSFLARTKILLEHRPVPKRLFIFTCDNSDGQGSTEWISELPTKTQITIYDCNKIARILLNHRRLGLQHIAALRNDRTRRLALISIGIFLVSSLAWLALRPKAPDQYSELFDQRITETEVALRQLRGLEDFLETTKDEITQRRAALAQLRTEHQEMQEVQKMNEEQLAIVLQIVKDSQKRSVWLDKAFGFLIGIASSFLASSFFARYQERKSSRPVK